MISYLKKGIFISLGLVVAIGVGASVTKRNNIEANAAGITYTYTFSPDSYARADFPLSGTNSIYYANFSTDPNGDGQNFIGTAGQYDTANVFWLGTNNSATSIANGVGEAVTSLDKHTGDVYATLYSTFSAELQTYSHAVLMNFDLSETSLGSIALNWGGVNSAGNIFVIYSVDSGVTWTKIGSTTTYASGSTTPGSISVSLTNLVNYSHIRFGFINTRTVAGKTLKLTSIIASPDTAAKVSSWIMDTSRDSDLCSNKYFIAKNKINSLSASELSTFQTSVDATISDARSRYTQWAAANGEVAFSTYNFAPSDSSNNSLLQIIIVAAIGLSAIGAYLMAGKRKEDQA